MKETQSLMGMNITVEVVDATATAADLQTTFDYFSEIDARFSTYKETSEISLLNAGHLPLTDCSDDMKTIFRLADETKQATDGYFDIGPIGNCDPAGIVKGWAIQQAADQLRQRGFDHLYINAGGDIQVYGHNADDQNWRVGIRNPFDLVENVKVLILTDRGIATSGVYERGQHISNPKNHQPIKDIVSLTVVGPNVYEADRFATAAFAMGEMGIQFIDELEGFEGYMINKEGQATMTRGLDQYFPH